MTTKILALTEALGNLVRLSLMPGQRHERWPGEFGQVDKWKLCLTAARMARIGRDHDETSTTDA